MPPRQGKDVSVVVLEKGSEVGAHILSGAVIDPVGARPPLPDWRNMGSPLTTEGHRGPLLLSLEDRRHPRAEPLHAAADEQSRLLYRQPRRLTRWLAEQAEALGVEIYPGFAVTDVIFGANGEIEGVITGDMGVARDGSHKDSYTPRHRASRQVHASSPKARAARSRKCSSSKLGLDAESGPQKFGIGLKELWEVPAEKHKPGLVQHTMGWPLDDKTGGGSFLYHFGERLVSVGFVVHLDYANPYINPFKEFQRAKTHPLIREHLEGGKRIAYGARALTEGGFQAIPQLAFPGGALIGCAAGFMNVPRIKGSHNAMLSGMMAAEAAFAAIEAGRAHDVLEAYPQSGRASAMAKELKKRAQRQAALVAARHASRRHARRHRHVAQHACFPFLRHTLKHQKPDYATLAQGRVSRRRSNIEKPDGVHHLRHSLIGVPVGHESRRKPAGAS